MNDTKNESCEYCEAVQVIDAAEKAEADATAEADAEAGICSEPLYEVELYHSTIMVCLHALMGKVSLTVPIADDDFKRAADNFAETNDAIQQLLRAKQIG